MPDIKFLGQTEYTGQEMDRFFNTTQPPTSGRLAQTIEDTIYVDFDRPQDTSIDLGQSERQQRGADGLAGIENDDYAVSCIKAAVAKAGF